MKETLKQGFNNILTRISHPTGEYVFKVKSRKTILMCCLWSESTIKTKKRNHAVFTSKFERMHINLIFFIINLEHAFVRWAQDKMHKTTEVHVKKQGSFFETYTCDMSKTTCFK